MTESIWAAHILRISRGSEYRLPTVNDHRFQIVEAYMDNVEAVLNI